MAGLTGLGEVLTGDSFSAWVSIQSPKPISDRKQPCELCIAMGAGTKDVRLNGVESVDRFIDQCTDFGGSTTGKLGGSPFSQDRTKPIQWQLHAFDEVEIVLHEITPRAGL